MTALERAYLCELWARRYDEQAAREEWRQRRWPLEDKAEVYRRAAARWRREAEVSRG